MTSPAVQHVLDRAESLGKAAQWEEAIAVLSSGLNEFERVDDSARDPDGEDRIELLFALSRCYFAQNRQDDARQYAQRILELDEGHVRATLQLGWCALAEGDLEENASWFRRALELGFEDWKLRSQLGLFDLVANRISEAEEHFTRAIELGCPDTSAVCNMAYLLSRGGRNDEAMTILGPMLKALPEDVPTLEIAANTLNYAEGPSADAVFEMHRRFGDAVEKLHPVDPAPFENDRTRDRRLRIGYLSGDFRTHSVAYFLLPLVQQHNRESIEVVLYSLAKGDHVTERFREEADLWRDCAALKDDALAEQIREDKIDVLVELSGLFQGHRMSMLARRAAPVQVTYCGYANTTGLTQVDYRMVDSVTDPPGAEKLVREQLVRLDPCFLTFSLLPTPSDASEAEEKPPCKRRRGPGRPITFGSFNNISKISPSAINAWCEILRRVPRSDLLIKAGALADEKVRKELAYEFTGRGIAQPRVRMMSATKTITDHLRLYEEVDIALDTFPYHGTTTTCEALSQGVPVITLTGDRHAARVGTSLLSAIGREEWVADSWSEYIDKACGLAEDPLRLDRIHDTLAGHFFESTLSQPAPLARRIEAAYRQMWYRWCDEGGNT